MEQSLIINDLCIDGTTMVHPREHEATICIDIEDESSIIDHLKRVFELGDQL